MHRAIYLGIGTITVAILSAACGGSSGDSTGTSSGSSTSSTNVSQNVITSPCQGASPKPGYSNGVAKLPNGATTLSGAGSTFVAPMMSVWTKQYATSDNVQVAYQSIGSGGGVAQIQAGTVDFGDSDAFMTDSDIAKAKGPIVQVPLVQAPVVPAYNLPGIKTGLNFDGETLGKLFAGKITTWNDPAIAKLNPGVNLPSLPVAIAHRSDGSGTTYIWTDFLTKESPTWVTALGGATTSVGKTVAWPTGIGGKGNEGVSGAINQTQGGLGYVELAYALEQNITYGYVKNKAGNFVKPCLQTSANATKGITSYPPDLRVDIVDQSTQPDAYPVTGLTWALLYQNQTDPSKAAALVDFFSWVLTTGQDLAPSVNYTPLGSDLQTLCVGQLKKLTLNGQPLVTS